MGRLWLAFVPVIGAHALVAVRGTGAVARARTVLGSASAREEAGLRQFWAAQWGSAEQSLLRLQDITRVLLAPHSKLALLQNGTSLGRTAGTRVTHDTTLAARLESLGVSSAPAKAVAALHLGKNSSVKAAVGAAMLAPTLAMLKDLYQQAHEKITELNKEEKKSKEKFAQKEKKHQANLARMTTESKKFHWSAGFLANETSGENMMFKHYVRQRDIQHQQYHTMLKLQHGIMSKEKKMIDMYEGTLAGGAARKKVEKEMTSKQEMPEIVFLQAVQSAKEFCVATLPTVRVQREEVERGDWSAGS